MEKPNDGFLMLLDAVYIGGTLVGYIAEKGIEWGGENAEKFKLHAAQVRNAPVKTIVKKAATNELKFTMIELIPENLKQLLGGEVVGDKWNSPSSAVVIEEAVRIQTGTGQTISISRATIEGAIRGTLGGDEVLGIETTATIELPADGSSPFSFEPTKPFITSTPASLTFAKGGETKMIVIEASGEFSMSAPPAGFFLEFRGGRVYVKASPNTGGAVRTGKITFTLKANPSMRVEVNLNQPN